MPSVRRLVAACMCVWLLTLLTTLVNVWRGAAPAPIQLQPASDKYGLNGTKPPSLRSNIWNFTVSSPQPGVKVESDDVVRTRDVYVDGHVWVHPELCADKAGEGEGEGQGVALVVAVMTSPGAHARRHAVRRSWGALATRSDVVLLFLLGKPPDRYKIDKLIEEDELYEDLVMAAGADSDSSLKTVSLLEWLALYCRAATLVLRTTDDAFVNMDKLMQFVTSYNPHKHGRTIWGHVVSGRAPERSDPQSPYNVSAVAFPGDTLPGFVVGGSYLFTADCVDRLLVACRDHVYIAQDHLFVPGVLAETVGIQRIHTPEFLNSVNTSELDPCLALERWVVPQVTALQQFQLWSSASNRALLCSQTSTTSSPGE